jgi:hypothetical protein
LNQAAENGPAKFAWWQDWRGKAAAIVACGPSVKNANVELLKGKFKVLAIKEALSRLVPFADVVYGCEEPWWNHVKGLPDYKGLKLAWEGSKINFEDVHRFALFSKTHDEIMVDAPGVIGAGGHSGFQALNIAVQFGASRILLVGYDLHLNKHVHFYGRNTWSRANNPNDTVFPRWIDGMERAAVKLSAMGVEVINASPVSKVQSFRKASIEEAISEWGL